MAAVLVTGCADRTPASEPAPLPMPCLAPPSAPCAGEHVTFRGRESTLTSEHRSYLAELVERVMASGYRVSLQAGIVNQVHGPHSSHDVPQLPTEEKQALADARREAVRDGLIAAGMPPKLIEMANSPIRESSENVEVEVGTGHVFFICTS